MSADDWERCPKCLEERKEILKKSYGKVPEDVYNRIKEFVEWTEDGENDSFCCFPYDDKIKLSNEIQEFISENDLDITYETNHSVRIDYNFGHSDKGEIYFTYELNCEYCDLANGVLYDEEKHKIVAKDTNKENNK